jgi:hypothetical protein
MRQTSSLNRLLPAKLVACAPGYFFSAGECGRFVEYYPGWQEMHHRNPITENRIFPSDPVMALAQEKAYREPVALQTQSADLTSANSGQVTVFPERFAGADVRDVNLDGRQGKGCKGVGKGNGSMAQPSCIYYQTLCIEAFTMKEVENFALMVGLKKADFHPGKISPQFDEEVFE